MAQGGPSRLPRRLRAPAGLQPPSSGSGSGEAGRDACLFPALVAAALGGPADHISNYDVLDTLPSSSSATLQLARPVLGPAARRSGSGTQRVVLKMLRVPCAGSRAASAAQRALREAEMMRALPASPHLLELLSVFCMPAADGSAHVLVLVLPYHPRGSLADELALRMRRQPARPYSEDEVRTMLRDLAHALAVAHDARIVHRDVKPENVLRADDGHLLLADFGLATKLASLPPGKQKARAEEERDDTLCGTPLYLSPETTTQRRTGPHVDIWALGCLAILLLTGEAPFDAPAQGEKGDTDHARVLRVLERIALGDWESVRARLNVSRPCEDLLQRMLHFEHEKRIDAPGVLRHAFLAPTSPHAISADSSSRLRQTVQPSAESATDDDGDAAALRVPRKVAGAQPVAARVSAPPSTSAMPPSKPRASHEDRRVPSTASLSAWAQLRVRSSSAHLESGAAGRTPKSSTRSRSASRSGSAAPSSRGVSLRAALQSMSLTPESALGSEPAGPERLLGQRTPFGIIRPPNVPLPGAEQLDDEDEESGEEASYVPQQAARAREKSAKQVPATPPDSGRASSPWQPAWGGGLGARGLVPTRQRTRMGRLEMRSDGTVLATVSVGGAEGKEVHMLVAPDGEQVRIEVSADDRAGSPASTLDVARRDLPEPLRPIYLHASRWLSRLRARTPLAAFVVRDTELGAATCTVMANVPQPDYVLRWSLSKREGGKTTEASEACAGELVVAISEGSRKARVWRRCVIQPRTAGADEAAWARTTLRLSRTPDEPARLGFDAHSPVARGLASLERAALDLALDCAPAARSIAMEALAL